MKTRIKYFLLLGIACSLIHFHLVVFLSQRRPLASFAGWALTIPANLLWGMPLARSYSLLLFVANSLLWGFCLGGVIFWLRLRHAQRPTIRFS